MSDILLGQSYFLYFDPKLWQVMQPYPPLGTLYAASYLRRLGYDVALFDAVLAESEGEWANALDRHHPRFAILYEDNFNYLSKMCLLRMRQAAFTMIKMANQRGCTVILCGADVTDHAEEYLREGAHYVLLGEGEATIAELLSHLSGESKIPLDQILGLAYPDAKSGEIQLNRRRPDIRDLDALPFPAWDLVDIQRYRSVWLKQHGYFSMNMVTTRGCPFHCNWCAKPIWGQRYNTRSPENVTAEMAWIKQNYAPDHIWFADDIFGLKPGWLPRFGELVESEHARIPFKCLSRADLLLRPGEVEALKKAGARIVWMGAESGSQSILDAMDKGTKVEQIYQSTRLLKAAGIQVGFFLQFGYPGERRTEIEQTIQLVRDCNPDDIGISVSYPMPGTKFYAAVSEQMAAKQNWQDSDDFAMLYHGPFSTQFYRKLHTVVHKEFRARKAWQVLRGSFNGISDVTWQKRFQLGARSVYNWVLLPLARWQLNRLAGKQTEDITLLPHMSHEAAAHPTPQNDR